MGVVELHHRDAGQGPPVVLLHAFPLSCAMWLSQRTALSSSYRVITPDQRGFGASALGADPPSLDAVADDVAALLDTKGIDSAIVGGLSMGGYVAMALLRRHSGRVRALVLADTKASADSDVAREKRERMATAVEAGGESAVLLDEVLPTLVGRTTVEFRPLVHGRIQGMVQSAPGPAVAWAQRAMAARPDSFDTLRAADVPTLVIVGEEDELSPPAEAAQLADAVPGAQLVRLAGAGHLSAVEVPEDFNAALLVFLAGLG